MTGADYIGLATLVSSVTASVIALVGLYRTRELHELVDGKSEALLVAVKEAALEKGKAEGIAAERADPQVPSPVP